jgi:hypothetical protein
MRTSAVNSFDKDPNTRLGPWTIQRPVTACRNSARMALARFHVFQFSGSRGDLVGIGRFNIRPSALIMKTLPERSPDACLDATELEGEELERRDSISLNIVSYWYLWSSREKCRLTDLYDAFGIYIHSFRRPSDSENHVRDTRKLSCFTLVGTHCIFTAPVYSGVQKV